MSNEIMLFYDEILFISPIYLNHLDQHQRNLQAVLQDGEKAGEPGLQGRFSPLSFPPQGWEDGHGDGTSPWRLFHGGCSPLIKWSTTQSTTAGDINTYTTSRYFLDHHLKGETRTECFVDAHCLRESQIEVYIGIKEISAHIFQSIFAVTNYIWLYFLTPSNSHGSNRKWEYETTQKWFFSLSTKTKVVLSAN